MRTLPLRAACDFRRCCSFLRAGAVHHAVVTLNQPGGQHPFFYIYACYLHILLLLLFYYCKTRRPGSTSSRNVFSIK